jgi:hypothetical protein
MRTIYGDHHRFVEHLLPDVPGLYFSGDGCKRDEDGYYWITGRVDDVINVSGHRMGTAEVESALVAHPKVAEAAVVGYPHEIKGQGIYAYVTLKAGEEYNDELKKELVKHVRKEIGPIATPDVIHWAPGLPKTRSGKIMRRILRKIAEDRPINSATPPRWPTRAWSRTWWMKSHAWADLNSPITANGDPNPQRSAAGFPCAPRAFRHRRRLGSARGSHEHTYAFQRG